MAVFIYNSFFFFMTPVRVAQRIEKMQDFLFTGCLQGIEYLVSWDVSYQRNRQGGLDLRLFLLKGNGCGNF